MAANYASMFIVYGWIFFYLRKRPAEQAAQK
jgi:hypothetical protein